MPGTSPHRRLYHSQTNRQALAGRRRAPASRQRVPGPCRLSLPPRFRTNEREPVWADLLGSGAVQFLSHASRQGRGVFRSSDPPQDKHQAERRPPVARCQAHVSFQGSRGHCRPLRPHARLAQFHQQRGFARKLVHSSPEAVQRPLELRRTGLRPSLHRRLSEPESHDCAIGLLLHSRPQHLEWLL